MQCIVFTDTERLAEKYRVSRQDVCNIIDRNLLHNQDVDFLLLDATDYVEELGNAPTWNSYKSILIDFMTGMGLTPSIKLGVFVIGGDDVIPMPRIPSPCSEDTLHADVLYCFKDDEISRFDPGEAICNIGRLPMENGLMPKSLSDDLQSYFNLCSMMLPLGIDVGSVLMTSTQSWIPASNEMVRGLPVDELPQIFDATSGNIYTSPRIDINDSVVMRRYQADLSRADLLLFNLHGSDVHRASSFYGEGAGGHNNPEAFSIGMLKNVSARIFNTVACYGGRYVGYNRTESMLLSAIYGSGIMLYAGSCVCALGRCGAIHTEACDILTPAGYSEAFMKLYSVYLFTGVSAGEAFLKAKCDYLNTCIGMDQEDGAVATAYMFNLYGLPALHVNRQKTVVDESRGSKQVRMINKGKPSTQLLYTKPSTTSGLLDEVRNRVDNNISHIRQAVDQSLYNHWGIDPRGLQRIEKIGNANGDDCYRFEYESIVNTLNNKKLVYADKNGRILDVVHIKMYNPKDELGRS